MKTIELSILTGNVVEENVPGVGGWGGTCRCPDGKEYEVGDNGDGCGSIACIDGEQVGDCKKYDGAWSGNEVTCQKGKK